VEEELRRAWLLFDPVEFAKLVLSGSPHDYWVKVTDPSQLPGIPYLPGIRYLMFDCPEGLIDLDAVRHLPALESLNIMGSTVVQDLAPLSGHPTLSYVLLQGHGPQIDLGPLAALPHLDHLRLFANRAADLDPISECVSLERLGLVSLRDFKQLPGSIPAQGLKGLELSSAPLQTLGPLLDIPPLMKLKKLELRNVRELRSIDGIGCWADNLQELALWKCLQLDSLEPLLALPRLTELQLDSETTMRHLRVLRKLPALKSILLYGDAAVDLSAFQGMKSLSLHVLSRQKVHGAELLGEGSKVIVHR
jgi:hypothetical protein